MERDCDGLFHCPHSSICIQISDICNSIKECPGLHDEVFCDLPSCIAGCNCLGYMIHCNNISKLSVLYSRKTIPYFVISVIFSNVKIHLLQLRYMKNLKFLDLTGNAIKHACSHISVVKNRLDWFSLASYVGLVIFYKSFK